jgi:threonine aldolase
MIDLRSDTVTLPTPEMRQAIANALLGDAVIDVDPTVEKLEQRTAEILGKEAAVFMPSGSMTNQVALRVHCPRGSEFICESDCHIYHYEQGAFAGLSGLVAKTIAGDQGVLRVEHLRGAINPNDDHHVRTQLLCLENTHNRWGGRIMPQDDVVEACWWAAGQGLKTHLDGARLWNAAIATGKSEAELCEPFDSVSVCFSKGLGAPVGSALAGEEKFVREARRARKLFGGAMRQAGIIAAGALHALDHHRDRLSTDHDHAKMLGDAARSCGAFSVRGGDVHTNIVAIDIDPDWGNGDMLQKHLADHGVNCFTIGPQSIRLVTHLSVSSQQIETACDVLKSAGA